MLGELMLLLTPILIVQFEFIFLGLFNYHLFLLVQCLLAKYIE